MSPNRRDILMVGGGLAATALGLPDAARAKAESMRIVKALIGGEAVESGRVRLSAPDVFPNGASLPITIDVDSPMTTRDHVRRIRVFAPRNPIEEVLSLRFEPGLSLPHASTRIRLAEPQHVAAVAEMQDGTLLMATRFVDVATNGCPTE